MTARRASSSRARPKTKKPSMYKVLLLNDDYTPMEFVVHVLERFFNKNREEATQIMLHVHRRGVGICGVFTYEVAETKVTQVIDFARQQPASAAVHVGKGIAPCCPRRFEQTLHRALGLCQRAPARICHAGASAAGADRGPGCGRRAARLRRRYRAPAPRPRRVCRQPALQPDHQRRRGASRPPASSACCSAPPSMCSPPAARR